MNVLLMLTDISGAPGGIAVYNERLLQAICSSSRVKVVLIVSRNGVRDEVRKISGKITTVKIIRHKLLFAAYSWWLLKRNDIDCLFCGHIYMTTLVNWITRGRKVSRWLQLHGVEAWRNDKNLDANCFNSWEMVTAVSRYTRKLFLSWSNIHPDKVMVLPNTFVEMEPDDEYLKIAEKKWHGQKILVSVGRLQKSEAYKGQDKIIKLLPSLVNKNRNLQYLIVGSGDWEPELRSLAADIGVSNHVAFISNLERSRVTALMKLADIFVMPSIGEGFGIVFLEAASLRTPVIAGNTDGSVDALREGMTGLLVDPGDMNSIENAISKIFRNIEIYQQKTETVEVFCFRNFSHLGARLLAKLA